MGIDACMEVEFDRDVTEEECLRWSWELCRVLGTNPDQGPFWASREGHALTLDNPRRMVVHLGGRYFGPGYERGNGMAYVSIGCWLELRTGGRVFYFGDLTLEPTAGDLFDREARRSLVEALIELPHVSNVRASAMSGPNCQRCKQPMERRAVGDEADGDIVGKALYACGVCDERRTIIDGVHETTFGEPARKPGDPMTCCRLSKDLVELLVDSEKLVARATGGAPFAYCPFCGRSALRQIE